MQFKYPELLYALLLLIIPIIVHLFRLRRFEKVDFTNVQVLKNITLKTRRSSQIKKWLTLFTRLLLLTCLIIAFAQPYQANKQHLDAKSETVIYLDNSFSMQTRGTNGSLLNTAIQDLITHIDEDENLTIFTNDRTFSNVKLKTIKNDLIQLKYSSQQLDYEAVVLKGQNYFSKDKKNLKNFILISDFQEKKTGFPMLSDSLIKHRLIQLQPKNIANTSIDSLYISKNNIETLELTVQLSNHGEPIEAMSISLIENDRLTAKTAVAIDDKAQSIFTVPNNQNFKGQVSIEDSNMYYDNTLYFSLNKINPIKILVIYEDKTDVEFLSKLFTDDEFDLRLANLNELNYNIIADQNLMVLHEIDNIPNALITSLKALTNDGGSALIIPSIESNISSYNQLFTELSFPKFNSKVATEKYITKINFSHPLLENVFEEKVDNFQYPKVSTYFTISQPPFSSILSFEDGSPFLFQNNSTYVFSAPLQEANSNFINSPLIVPVLYNIGKNSLKPSQLYYMIGQKNIIDMKVALQQDEILKLNSQEESLIPLQQTFSQKVQIVTEASPTKAGNYEVKNKENVVGQLSFNYDRVESLLSYMDVSKVGNHAINNSIASAIEDIKSSTNVKELWKWFVIFAIAFLIIEMLILKFIK